jgi:membrane protease YdiL (CAAX protease family)
VIFGWLPNKPIPVLMLSATCLIILLWRDPHYDLNELLNTDGIREGILPVIRRFVCLVFVLGMLVWWLEPESLFGLMRVSPLVWALVMIGYPIFSVYPQEVIFRAFIFHRYHPLFSQPMHMILASAAVFAWVHIVFGSWVSVALSFLGGILFGLTYLRYRSLLLAAIEHALYGQFVFTIGLGHYFYHGASRFQ